MEWIQLAQDNTVADSCQYTYIKKQRIYTDYLSDQQLVNDCLVEFETNTTWKILINSYGMWRESVRWKFTDVSKHRTARIITVE
jgi:hypothetical protein